MFTVYQLVQKINLEYPNNGFVYNPQVNYETDIDPNFIYYINSALDRIDKYIMLDEIYEFPTIKGQSIYELPLDCEMGNIGEVVRGVSPDTSIRLVWSRNAEPMFGHRYYNAYGNMIGIFPVPTCDNEKITIFYKKKPMKVNTKDDPIEIKDEWIDLLVYAVVADIASSGSNPDVELSNNYTLKYNNLLQLAMREKAEQYPYYPQTKDNMSPPVKFFRRWR